ncbi:hypothetical protein GIB67_000148 [Kingdonia uniflora]|uniref:Rab3-GAP regulatory subunit N-terminal domain-containing protein n=1 Tax=Kingdonia uniflora TaxID=39325 RepID=A0A7J7PA86_9MAGN|nr:hypothetical protein GIB67_000148 [Kingdonia uniflora]
MSKRTHLTELGSITCPELSEFGAGNEGPNPFLLTALDTQSLALATPSLVLIINWNHLHPPIKIRPSTIEGDVTAVEWIIFDEIRVLVLGTSNGYLLFYSLAADLIHKQMVHPGRILRLRVRRARNSLTEDTSSEEVCVVMRGVIARFDGSDIQSFLRRWFQDERPQFWNQKPEMRESDLGISYGRLPYQLWSACKYGSCSDAAITGIMPPPLLEPQSSERYYCAVTIGEDAVISAYRLSEDRRRSLVGAILSKVVPVAFSALSSVSRMIWRSDQASTRKSEVKPQPFARGDPAKQLSVWYAIHLLCLSIIYDENLFTEFVAAFSLTCLKDNPRKGETLTLSPSGTLAAITDSLGRILLLDTQALVVVRIWKGYRDACCLFMEMLVGSDTVSSSSAYAEHTKSDYCLCLAIHAPRKAIVECVITET